MSRPERRIALLVVSMILVMASLSGCSGAGARPLETIDGPERTDLAARVEGTILLPRPVGGMVAIELPGLNESTIRPPDEGSNPVSALSGPDTIGRIAFIQNDGEQHSLREISRTGAGEREVFSRPGGALWDQVVGKHVGLSPVNGRVALFSGIHLEKLPSFSWRVGNLELFDLSTGAMTPIDGGGLSDYPLAWFPDGVHLALCGLVDRSAGAELITRHLGQDSGYAEHWMQWEKFPAVYVLDTQTGSRDMVFPGTNPVVSPDGRRLLMGAPKNRHVLFDLDDRTAREVTLPGFTDGPYAFVDDGVVLYMGLPTTGAATGYSKNNSPLVGKKPMRTLKIADIEAGGFQTVVESIDPRSTPSFGR